jgi:HEPN domain-containing protein
MHELVQEWLLKAEEDWDSARVLLGDDSPLVTPALFRMQQCAEKLLKALLIKKKTPFERFFAIFSGSRLIIRVLG